MDAFKRIVPRRCDFHPIGCSIVSLRGLPRSGRQRLEIRNDVAPMLGVGKLMTILSGTSAGVLQELVTSRLLVSSDVRRFQGAVFEKSGPVSGDQCDEQAFQPKWWNSSPL